MVLIGEKSLVETRSELLSFLTGKKKKKHLVESISIVNLFLVCTYSHVHNILRLSDSSTNFPSTTSGTNRNY